MRIGLMSDMHLEFGAYNEAMGEGDLLLLSGDIMVAAHLAAVVSEEFLERHPEHVRRLLRVVKGADEFMDRACKRYTTVAYVAGNHEHYGLQVSETLRTIEDRYAERYNNLAILEKEAIEVGDVMVFGATLWTDFNRCDPKTMLTAANSMNDYRQIWIDDGGDRRNIRPGDVYEDHLEALRALDAHADHAHQIGKPLIVMSHHGPSRKSCHARYHNQFEMNGCYNSDLTAHMGPHIPLWVHGHTHDSYDYEVNGTRVVCNPRGYWSPDMRSLNKSFKGDLELVV